MNFKCKTKINISIINFLIIPIAIDISGNQNLKMQCVFNLFWTFKKSKNNFK
jgi:hypothetical protein